MHITPTENDFSRTPWPSELFEPSVPPGGGGVDYRAAPPSLAISSPSHRPLLASFRPGNGSLFLTAPSEPEPLRLRRTLFANRVAQQLSSFAPSAPALASRDDGDDDGGGGGGSGGVL